LSRFCQSSEQPVVLVLDEIDALVGDTLISVLRQIRAGYPQRPAQFPSSIILCGVRDVRDYRIHSGSGKEIITGGSAWYITPDHRLDMTKLMAAFQAFFQEHSQHWLERFQYKEAGPKLLLQAFLQRIINSGGRIEREYGLGRQRMDLLVLWPLTRATDNRPPLDPVARTGPEGGAGTESAAPQPGNDDGKGTGTDPPIHGHLRDDRRTSGDFQPGPRCVMGRQNFPENRTLPGDPNHCLGNVRPQMKPLAAGINPLSKSRENVQGPG
jgi:hypothetical protein